MRLALALIFPLLSACIELDLNMSTDRPRSLSTEERAALHDQAREGARLSWERYVATTRPALERQFRQEYPTMTQADLELLVNDALEKGLHQEVGRQRLDPKSPPINCMGPYRGRGLFPNCY